MIETRFLERFKGKETKAPQELANSPSDVFELNRNRIRNIEANGFVYLLLDCSGSMAGQKIDQAKRGGLKFSSDAIAKGYRVGLIKFDSQATHLCESQRILSNLDSLLKDITIGGSTNMIDAIQLATQKLLDKGPFRIICIVTDGMPDDPKGTLVAAQQAKENRIDIIAVGTDDANQDFLKKIATRRELGLKVTQDQFKNTIASTAKMLPGR